MSTDPKIGQIVWRYHHGQKRPVQVQYLGRNGTWRKWKRGAEPIFNENGCRAWFTNPVNCQWAAFEDALKRYAYAERARLPLSPRRDDVYDAVCEYVRQFSDQFGKKPADVWREAPKPEATA